MKLSIIMPCFNVSETIIRALDSIIMQRVNFDYEIIIIDDASTDQTVEIVKEYSKRCSQIKIICNESNRGNAYTYYTGLCASKGDYICVLDGDDYYTIPDKLQRQVDFLDSDVEEEYVGTATQYIIDLGNNMVSIPARSNFKWISYADFLTQKTDYYHTSTYMYRNIFRGNVPIQMSEELYRGDTPRTMFHLQYSGKKIRILDFVGSAYTYEFNGIWSGLKPKAQYEYQVSYLTRHKENVLTDFERLSADKQIEWYRKQIETTTDDFVCYPSVSIDQALEYISEYAGTFAFAQKNFVSQHVYVSSYIDTLCASLGFVEMIRNPQHIQKERNPQHICIVIGVLNSLASEMLEEIKELISIYSSKKVYLIVTATNEMSEREIDILNQYSNLEILSPPVHCTEQLGWFRRQFVKIAPFRTYYYCSHNDVYGVALAQMGRCENVTIFSFDHGFLCGVLNPNLDRIIAKRPTDYWMLKRQLKENVIFIPACGKKASGCENEKYVPFKNHDRLITASGTACDDKVSGYAPYRYIDMVITMLKYTKGTHYHFGELSKSERNEIADKLKLEGIVRERFVYIPRAENISLALLKNQVDIFIEPFPIVSYRLTLEAMSVGIPVIAYKGLERMNISDFIPKDALFWKDSKEFFYIILNLTKEILTEQSRNILNYFNEYHNIQKVSRLLQKNAGLPEPEKYFYSDNTLIDITTSFQLFGNNYKIDIMNKGGQG